MACFRPSPTFLPGFAHWAGADGGHGAEPIGPGGFEDAGKGVSGSALAGMHGYVVVAYQDVAGITGANGRWCKPAATSPPSLWREVAREAYPGAVLRRFE